MLNDYIYVYVEDDKLSREIMYTIMRRIIGVTNLTIFEDSQDFMKRLKSLPQKPDVVFLDIHILPLNGFELMEMIRTDPELMGKKVIALTASVMNEEVAKLRNGGFDGAVAKPLSAKTFPGLLERIVKGEAVWHIV